LVNGDEPGPLSVLGPQKLTISGKFLGLLIFYYLSALMTFFYYLLGSALSFHSNKGSGIHFCVHTDWSRASVISPRKQGKSCDHFNWLSTYYFLK